MEIGDWKLVRDEVSYLLALSLLRLNFYCYVTLFINSVM